MKAIKLLARLSWFALSAAAFTMGAIFIISFAVVAISGEGCVRLAVKDGGTYETSGCVRKGGL